VPEDRRRVREEKLPIRKPNAHSGELRPPYDTMPRTKATTASQRAAVLVARQEIDGIGMAKRSGYEALREVPGGDLFNRSSAPAVTRRATGAPIT
jgi:hypothetical protein